MLRGEIITFFEAGALFSISLKISKANVFSDSINDTCFNVRSIETGLSGSLFSAVFSQEIKIIEIAREEIIPIFNILVFIKLWFNESYKKENSNKIRFSIYLKSKNHAINYSFSKKASRPGYLNFLAAISGG